MTPAITSSLPARGTGGRIDTAALPWPWTGTRLWPVFWLLVVALRLWPADPGLWFDEVQLLAESVRLPLARLLTSYPTDNNHPLYSLLAWLSCAALGEGSYALRLPAALLGIASVWAFLRLAREVTSLGESLLATVALGLSYHHVWFSQNARGYTGLLLFTLLAARSFLLVLRGERRQWPWLSLQLALASYTHLTGVFVALAMVGVLAVEWRALDLGTRRVGVLAVVAAGALSLLLHAPLLPEMLAFFQRKGGGVQSEWTSLGWMLRESLRGFGLVSGFGLVALLLGLWVLMRGLQSYWRQDRAVALLFVLPGALAFLVFAVMGRNLWPRVFFFVAGFALLPGLRGLLVIAPWLSGSAFVRARVRMILWLLVLVAALAVVDPKQDFAGARDAARALCRPQEAVVTVGLAIQPYQWLYAPELIPVRSVAELEHQLSGRRGLWILDTFPIFLRSRDPALAAVLEARAPEHSRFKGSLGGGDVVLRYLPGR